MTYISREGNIILGKNRHKDTKARRIHFVSLSLRGNTSSAEVLPQPKLFLQAPPGAIQIKACLAGQAGTSCFLKSLKLTAMVVDFA